MFKLKKLCKEEKGIALTEYIIILGMVAMASIVVVNFFGDKIREVFTQSFGRVDEGVLSLISKKKIVDARNDEKGNVKEVRFMGKDEFVPVAEAMQMAEKGEIENAHVVKRKDGTKYLRSNIDLSKDNNLDEMAK